MTTAATIDSFHAIVPAGGAGTRLWPLSRAGNPKFLLDLTGSGRSLLQQTWDRLLPLTGPDQIHVVTGAAHAAAVAAQLPELRHLIVEPSPRDSMPAIALAAALIEAADPGAVVGSFAADHVINDAAGFRADVALAAATARHGKICTIGIAPDTPSTAFGYIEAGAPLGLADAPGAVAVTRFVEKPDAATASRYLDSKAFYWNAGMFLMRAQVLLDHLARLQPDLHAGVRAIAGNWDGPQRQSVLERTWPTLTRIAIDHAIAEPVAADGGVAMVPAQFDWSDLGDFAALGTLAPPPGDNTLFLDASGLVRAPHRKTVTVIGIGGVVVIDSADALLVTTAEHAQRVKEATAAWRSRGREDLL